MSLEFKAVGFGLRRQRGDYTAKKPRQQIDKFAVVINIKRQI